MKLQYFVHSGKKTTSFNDLADAHAAAEKIARKTKMAEITSRVDWAPEEKVCTVYAHKRTDWYPEED